MRCAPALSSDLVAPTRDPVHAVLADRIDDVTVLSRELTSQLEIGRLIIERRIVLGDSHVGVAAPVVLHVVKTPSRPRRRVNRLISPTARATAAGERTRRGVNPDLESLRVHVVGKPLHVGEACVRDDRAVTPPHRPMNVGMGVITLVVAPEVVDVHIAPAEVDETLAHEGVCRGTDVIRRDGACEAVPRVPPHRRRKGDAIADDQTVDARVGPLPVRRRDRDRIFAATGDRTRENA